MTDGETRFPKSKVVDFITDVEIKCPKVLGFMADDDFSCTEGVSLITSDEDGARG